MTKFMQRSSRPVPDRGDGDGKGDQSHRFRPLIIAITISFLLVGSVHGTTLKVGPEESIQKALYFAKAGDTVLVEGGYHKGNLVLEEGIVLRGTGGAVIDGGSFGSVVTLKAGEIVLEGFEISGSGPGERDAGIRVLAQNCTVKENSIVGNSIGILLQDARDVQVSSNIVEKNNVGIYLETSWGNEIRFNRIAENDEGIHISRNNATKSMTTSESGGVSIKYRPKTEASSLKVSEIGFRGAYQDNLIFGNEFLKNGQNAYDDGDNLWHQEEQGNWYEDFDAIEEGCMDGNRDGICDSSYEIAGGSSVDPYPLASEDAILRHRAVFEDYELILYQSTFAPGESIMLEFKAPDNFSGRVDLTTFVSDSSETTKIVAISSEVIGIGASTGTVGLIASNESIDSISAAAIDSISSIPFLAPSDEGDYAFRMYDDTETELVSLSIEVATPTISVSANTTSTCDRVQVNYGGAPGLEGGWVGLYSTGSQDGDPISKKSLGETSNGSLAFSMPSASGTYEFRMFQDDSQASIARSESLEVKELAGVRITATPSKVKPGERIEVSFWGAKPESAIGMYEMTRPDKYMLAMQYANGRSCGTMTFKAPSTPGRYDFRFFENNVYRKLMGASNVVLVE